MDEGRYGQVRRQEDRHRKFVCIINDILKTKTDVYESCLSREKYETSFKYVKNAMTVRRALVRQKVLQKCLEMRRRRTDGGVFGRYNGASLHSMSRDVESYIASKHPKVRRLQKVQKLLKDSVDSGAILDTEAMNGKVEEFFRKRIENLENRKTTRHSVKDGTVDNGGTETEGRVSIQTVKGKVQKLKVTPLPELKVKDKLIDLDTSDQRFIREIVSPSQGDTNPFVLKRRPTLVLPPITPSKALVQY
ncbi:uncharacterized protein LOC124266176 [Haliotis rubra]|uniref:uncharacterized protein LOC124266176 n=1 Tax=Haliotis rubra TaxID=36100 RepID=UPI001EE580C9|nr:uncharacterized protein LOC124266176 [Haliotis rubra]XP_046556935.1 uncharacterized protein LOC124266176 [Haliotis rubra]XP_046556936.1 uncharacterized protein LOC124266176 [Haliotis rubra]